MNNIKTEMELTAKYMTELVYPQIQKLGWIKGELYSIENNPDDTLKMLDTRSAIDGFILESNGSIPISTRCQYGTSYSTFTIRRSLRSGKKTEYDKVSYAINHPGYTYPHFYIHAYLTSKYNGKLISMGMARTKDIYPLISEDNINSAPDGNTFYFVRWDALTANGKKCRTKIF